jgi:hypothetical protein
MIVYKSAGFQEYMVHPVCPKIVFFRSEERTFFVYGFAKSDRDNIGQKELRAFKDDAQDQLALTDEQLKMWLENKTLVEVI